MTPWDYCSPWMWDTEDRREQIPNMLIPCGKCEGCLTDRAKQWAVRNIIESKEHVDNWFVTLTYDEEHVPHGYDTQTGAYSGYTLNKKHLSAFMKRLRSKLSDQYGHTGIRFFACGEYGETFFRPHYHILLYNCPLPDLRLHRVTKLGHKCWRSKIIEDAWNMGITEVSEFNWQTASYVSRYVMKKKGNQQESENIMKLAGLQPEFTEMSTAPGIGRARYDAQKMKIYDLDELFVDTGTKVLKLHSLKYYDKLYGIEQPELMKEIKYQRRLWADEAEKNQDSKTTLTRVERRLFQEEQLKKRHKRLPRQLE